MKTSELKEENWYRLHSLLLYISPKDNEAFFVIGNGFDFSHGINSSYRVLKYKNSPSASHDANREKHLLHQWRGIQVPILFRRIETGTELRGSTWHLVVTSYDRLWESPF